ncbi:MAG: LacI family DNA-binding transcriptional regulator [Acidobacteriaceae bacterium]
MTKKSKHPTLSEVAKRAGVGTTTVSRVINGVEHVEPQTLARVERAIKELGYSPNQAARVLKGHRTRTIGFVVPSIADPFFSSCAEVLQAIARKNDFLLIVLTTQNEVGTERDAVNILMQHRVDGFVIAPADSESEELRVHLARVPVPIVALDRPVVGSPVPSVVADNFVGARHATQHLIEHGYKRIVCLTGEVNLYTIRERVRGYCSAMESANLKTEIDTSLHDYESAERMLIKMFRERNPPDAIFTLKNSTTIDVFEALQRMGISVPKTVALLGYDDFQLADTVRPAITVVQQPIEELGHVAAELLFSKLLGASNSGEGGEKNVEHQVQLKTILILRNSCGCTPSAS